MAERIATVRAVVGVVLCAVCAAGRAGEAVTGRRGRVVPKRSGVVVTKTSEPGVVVHVRALLVRRAPQDPIKLAVRFSGADAPLAPGRPPRLPAVDFIKTFESLTFELTTPDGREHRLRAAVIDKRPRWKKQPSSLASDATWFVDLTADGLETSLGLGGNWLLKAAPDLTQPGEYRVRLAGRLVTADKKTVEFKSPAPPTRVVKGYKPVAELERLAMAAIARHLPAFKPAKQGYTGSGYRPGMIYEEDNGDRVIHRNGLLGRQKFGYDLARVVISPRGMVRSVAYRDVSTCIAAGTPIDTPRGAVRVEHLREGDEVWGYDLKARRRVAATVRTIRRAVATHSLRIGPSLRITGNHPVYTPAGWLPAGELRREHRLLDRCGRWTPAGTVRLVEGRVAVFDLTVDAPHTYFAGGVLVHNKSRPWYPNLDDPWCFYWPDKPHKFTVAYKQAAGAEAQTKPASKEIAALIRQLGHAEWKVREAATQKLKKMGKGVFGVLREARKKKGLDPEVAQRLDLILGPPPAVAAKAATDPATGVTVSVEPDGAIAARIHGKMLWRLRLAQVRGKATGLTIVNGRVFVQPLGAEIDLKTGRLLQIRTMH